MADIIVENDTPARSNGMGTIGIIILVILLIALAVWGLPYLFGSADTTTVSPTTTTTTSGQ